MRVHVRVFDSAKKIVFKTDDEVPAIMLMVMGESREAMMRDGGLIEASETVNFFGKKLLDDMKAGRRGEELRLSMMNVMMFLWLANSIYGDLDAERFSRSDAKVWVRQADGVVSKFKCVPCSDA
jgi:hypothetical protein